MTDGGGRGKSFTPAHIQVRGEEAKFKREVLRIGKAQRQIEQKYKVSERKNTATQRGIISLLGNDVYLDPGIKHASVLYGQNIPGFCYRRNGDPRRPCSIYESKTSRVIHTLDGTDGLLEEEASNVVSDNPLLDEILSSPQVLPILCDLRTTALLGRNPQLLFQFVEGLREQRATQNPLHPLLFPPNQDTMTSLKRYRAVLIQNLFEAIRILVELRLNSARDNPRLGNPPMNSAASSQRQETAETWNEVLMTKLQVLADKEKSEDSEPEVSIEPGEPEVTIEEEPLLFSLPDSIDSSDVLLNDCWRTQPISSFPNSHDSNCFPHTEEGTTKTNCEANSAEGPPSKGLETMLVEMRARRRARLKATVKGLIREVQDVEKLGKIIREMRRKNPCRAQCSTGILEKLLKSDVFTSLNVEYCNLLQDQGKLKGSEYQQCLVPKDSGTINLQGKTEPALQKSDGAPRPLKTPSYNFDEVLHKINSSTRLLRRKGKGHLKTKNRLCCPACKAKLRQGFEKFKERDEKFQKQLAQGGKQPNGKLMREIEKLTEQIGFHPLPDFDMYDPGTASPEPLRTIHIQDSPELEMDESSFNAFPLSLNLSGVPSFKWSTAVTGPSSTLGLPASVKLFPDLATPQSYAPSPVPKFTVPIPSPGPYRPPPLIQKGGNPTGSKRVGPRAQAQTTTEKAPPMSWTLKVSRFDLFKLRHELQRVAMEERMLELTQHLSMQNAEDMYMATEHGPAHAHHRHRQPRPTNQIPPSSTMTQLQEEI